ncbi:peptide chain release factor N(5)-glutamine methyltransferase [Pontimicrobium sp. SW4]|uniref:Release factor glutamine methyltransferase n=1 Tax=Pontimicrobium sp. SW4 TaxID=3153519 RepID=A0AAU7BQ41_9FLAO
MILKSLRTYFNNALIGYYPDTEIDSFFNMLSDHILKMKRVDISQNLYAVVSGKKYDKYQNAIDRLKNYEPIQYILGDTEFYGLVFKVNPSVLIPRPETEELVAWIINEHKNKEGISILDIGTGSGCIAITLAKNLPNAKVFALDVSENALKLAKQNAISNDVEVEFIEADILDWDFNSLQFDVIVSNPPYVRELEKETMSANVLNHEPHLALFVKDDDALLFYRKITEISNEILKPNGQLYFEINENLGESTKELLANSNFKNVDLKMDIFEKDRMIKAIKG